MKVIIIDDDTEDAEYILKTLIKLSFPAEAIKILSSATRAQDFLRQNPANLIFCNIEIATVNCFDILEQAKINTPVIYYSDDVSSVIEAFKYNAIGYMLKPLTKKTITDSILVYKALRDGFNSAANYNTNADLPKKADRNSSLIINWKDKIIPIKIKEIALFNIEYKMTQIVTFTNRRYFIADTLENLEEICGTDFYRANRQFLINREAIAEAAQHFARKLVLKLKVEGEYEIIISKNRVPEFLSWLKN
jgi:two-component system response regulator LytT